MELFFLSADRKLMVVDINGGAKFEAGVPKPLFEARIAAGTVHFNVGKNGRFLIPAQTEHAASGPMNVVVNWTAGLKVPTSAPTKSSHRLVRDRSGDQASRNHMLLTYRFLHTSY